MENTVNLPRLKISQNRRYMLTENDQPFFWLGDTAWEMIHRLSKEEVLIYLKDRAAKGFNVVQTVILAELDGLNIPNAYGDQPLLDFDPAQPNEPYFNYLDQIIGWAGELGIYIALLPTWGDKFNKAWGLGPEIFTADNAAQYGDYLGKRYSTYSNIVWVMGGDRIPATEDHYMIIRAMARGIKQADPGHLMTYHPKGGKIASDWFGQDEWLDFDMFQTRHQRGFKEYRFTRRALAAQPVRPVIDGEPGYENIPNLLNKLMLKRLEAADVRKTAYWNMFAGAAGHTYGCNEVWQMYDLDKKALFGAHLPWREAIDLPGGRQMGYLRRLFESLPWQTLKNDQQLLFPTFLANIRSILAMITEEQDMILVYTPRRKAFRVRLSRMQAKEVKIFWFDPVNGKVHEGKNYLTSSSKKLKAPKNITGKDAVCLIVEKRKSIDWQKGYDAITYSL